MGRSAPRHLGAEVLGRVRTERWHTSLTEAFSRFPGMDKSGRDRRGPYDPGHAGDGSKSLQVSGI